MYWVYGIPTHLLGLMVISLFVFGSMAGLLLTRPLIKRYFVRRGHHNEITSYYFGAISLLYALILGQVTAITYQNYEQAKKTVAHEASSIIRLFNELEGYPHPQKETLENYLSGYVQQVIAIDWQEHREGLISNISSVKLEEMEAMILKYEPQTETQKILHSEVLDTLNEVVEARSERNLMVGTGLPAPFWFVILFGSMITIFTSYLFYFENLRLHIFLVSSFSSIIGLVVFLSLAMDHPFRGDVSVTVDGYLDAQAFASELKSQREVKH